MIVVNENVIVNLGKAEVVKVTARGDSDVIIVRVVAEFPHRTEYIDYPIKFDGVEISRSVCDEIENAVASEISLNMGGQSVVLPYSVILSVAIRRVFGGKVEIKQEGSVLVVKKVDKK